ncbi:MAG TPA: asparagine synthase-related protein [Candidatus Nanoarchaeia archaeon]|nr:asparagine synthase-related protein [Candidatus Nanoarchaeia archaeon]
MIELYLDASGLINETAWKERIAVLHKQTQAESTLTKESAQIETLQRVLRDAVRSRISGRFGLLLSGGVDSSLLALLCKEHQADFVCYNVGIQGSPDVEAAQIAASMLNLRLKQRIFTIDELEQLFRRAAQILPIVDVVSLGVAAVEIAAVELAQQDGTNILMGGLGSEEIFAGYERHAHAAEVNAECWQGLENMYVRDLVRDAAVAKHCGVQFVTPFLDSELIVAAMRIPGSGKIAKGEKKVILRKTAESLGLPKEISWRKKHAAQYGSRFDAVLEKLAKRAGMGKQEYVQELVQ